VEKIKINRGNLLRRKKTCGEKMAFNMASLPTAQSPP
jgi:hypothetical protein